MRRAQQMDCEQVRKQAYRYRRGELIGAETGAIEAHTDDCATCRDYYERLGILLDSASAWEPADEASDADDLFAGITARIQETDEAAAAAVEPAEYDDDEDFGDGLGARRWVYGVIGLAAGVLLTLGGFYLFEQLGAFEAPGAGAESTVVGNDEATQDSTSGAALEKLARQESGSSQVQVFASKGAAWSLGDGEAPGDQDLVLELERGSLLVEFVPEDGRTLRVDAPEMSVRVVGTVFFVSAEKDAPRAGVLAGEVEVSSAGGATATLGAERELGAGFEVREMPEARRAALARHVDPRAHQAKLAALVRPSEKRAPNERAGSNKPARSNKPAVSDKPAAPNKPAVSDASAEPGDAATGEARRLPPDLERLRARAERATRRGSYHDAVRYYRSLLDRLPPMHPIAASIHLDLAQIYLHRLNSPGRAAPHLRTFVERWPSDVAAESARRELCKIDASQPGCEVGE